MPRTHTFLLVFMSILGASASGQHGPEAIRELLVLDRVGKGGRAPVFTDPIETKLVAGDWAPPREGDEVAGPDGKPRAWRRVTAGEDGAFDLRSARGGWAWASVESGQDRPALLRARGHRHVNINGEPRVGDVYAQGIVETPFTLRKGDNGFLFKLGRGRLSASIQNLVFDFTVLDKDRTLPDVIVGEREPLWGAFLVANTGRKPITVALRAKGGETIPAGVLEPGSFRKAAFVFTPPAKIEGDKITCDVEVLIGELLEVHEVVSLELRVRKPDQWCVRTFRSEIEGSVQYYGVTPRRVDGPQSGEPGGLILTLHGAGVEGRRQARGYKAKDWADVVAPTNRRPFGFDWEDWGRLDALEVLALARKRFAPDPSRIVLTGHSMGGHGTWSLGAHFPDRFAAIAPSAGWRDFWSYGGAARWDEPTPVQAMLTRAANSSRTLLLENNYLHSGIYVLHGDADETVPVAQARFMRNRLAEFHPNWAYYERPGAGHWWGDECMDWPPLIEFLSRNRRPADADVASVRFTTIDPGLSSSCYWLQIVAQQQSLVPSLLEAKLDGKERRLEVKTENVRAAGFELAGREDLPPGDRVRLDVDGQTLETTWPERGRLDLVRAADGRWTLGAFPASSKSPRRAGPFKDAFRNRMVFVYGTDGSETETKWARAKARYDAETFWYRGNGSVPVMSDRAFLATTASEGRNVILYGHAEMNAAWGEVIGADAPITVKRGAVTVGERTLEGKDLAALFIVPRKGTDDASVGVVAGTGASGLALTNQLPYFVSGVAYPDWAVIGTDMLEKGTGGLRGAGFFDSDWKYAESQSAWRD